MLRVAPAASALTLDGSNLTLVIVVAVVAVIALGMGVFFRQQVLSHDAGTEKMQEIGAAVEEGAQAYLARQFKTLGIFVVLVFGLLLLLPADTAGIRWGRSAFFVVGALFSASIGYLGMSLAVKANVRLASACSAPRSSSCSTRATPPRSSRASASVRPCSRCSCGSAAASSPRPPTWAPTSSARSRPASPRTTPATPRPSPTTSATTSV